VQDDALLLASLPEDDRGDLTEVMLAMGHSEEEMKEGEKTIREILEPRAGIVVAPDRRRKSTTWLPMSFRPCRANQWGPRFPPSFQNLANRLLAFLHLLFRMAHRQHYFRQISSIIFGKACQQQCHRLHNENPQIEIWILHPAPFSPLFLTLMSVLLSA